MYFSQGWNYSECEEHLPQTGKIILSSKAGRFMNTPPFIARNNKMFVMITEARDNVIEDVFHYKKIKRGRKRGKNKQLVLICPHQSENLWKQTISLVARRTSGADSLDRISAILNRPQNNGSEDPDVEMREQDTIRKVGNFVDKSTSNKYIFEG